MERVFKVLVVEDGVIKNLFKGIEGSRTLPLDTWLRAENKWSVDGSGQEEYLTGIHCLLNKEKAINYLDNFRTDRDRIVVECYAKDLRQKPTNNDVYLADWLYIPEENVEEYL